MWSVHSYGNAMSRRVLIVDDNPDQVSSLAELLRLEGHTVEYATNALYALSMAKEFHPEFVFLDIGMPYMDGYEALRRFKRDFPGAYIVAMTGRVAEEQIASSAGFDAYLLKPVDFEIIRKLLRTPA